MTRGIDPVILAALESPSVAPIYFLELEIDSSASPEVWVRLHTGLGTFDTATSENATVRTFTGAGSLLAFDSVRETNQINPQPLRVTLSGVDSSISGLVLNQNTYRRPCRAYICTMSNGVLDANPAMFFSGFIESLEMVLADPKNGDSVALTAESELLLLKRSRNVRYTSEDLQAEFPGDLGLVYLADTAVSKVVWRARQNRMGSRSSSSLQGQIISAARRARGR